MTSRITLDVVGRAASVTINAVGEHWALNVAAALLAASQTGRSVEDCAEALSGYAPPPGRGTAETLALPGGGSFTLIDDAYNANPASMRAAAASLSQRTGGRRLAALGDMREIGASSTAEHIALMARFLTLELKEFFSLVQKCNASPKPFRRGSAGICSVCG